MAPSEAELLPKSFKWSGTLRARHVALPAEHGSWIFLFSPLVIGLGIGGARPASLLLLLAVLAAFLIRQPVTMAVKISSGRRSKREIAPTIFWLVVYGLVGLAAFTAMVLAGYGFLAWLALPAIPVLAWHLWLVRRRSERRQMLIQIVASAVLALTAPAFYWVGTGQVSSTGWLLWVLAWLQVAGTILYFYCCLVYLTSKGQRR